MGVWVGGGGWGVEGRGALRNAGVVELGLGVWGGGGAVPAVAEAPGAGRWAGARCGLARQSRASHSPCALAPTSVALSLAHITSPLVLGMGSDSRLPVGRS